jgi:hypothetical protein
LLDRSDAAHPQDEALPPEPAGHAPVHAGPGSEWRCSRREPRPDRLRTDARHLESSNPGNNHRAIESHGFEKVAKVRPPWGSDTSGDHDVALRPLERTGAWPRPRRYPKR